MIPATAFLDDYASPLGTAARRIDLYDAWPETGATSLAHIIVAPGPQVAAATRTGIATHYGVTDPATGRLVRSGLLEWPAQLRQGQTPRLKISIDFTTERT